MIRRMKAWALGLAMTALLAACGGGGGSAGDCALGCGGGGGPGDAAYVVGIDVQRSGASVSSDSIAPMPVMQDVPLSKPRPSRMYTLSG